MKLHFAILSMLFSILLSLCSVLKAQAGRTIKQVFGYVEYETSKPIAGVEVILEDEGYETQTTANGKFVINGEFEIGKEYDLKFVYKVKLGDSNKVERVLGINGNFGTIKLTHYKQKGLWILFKEAGSTGNYLKGVEIEVMGKTYSYPHTANVKIPIDESELPYNKDISLVFKKYGYEGRAITVPYRDRSEQIRVSLKKKQ